MAIKAGRVGVAPDQVDMSGRIVGEGSDAYTKAESDAKFATKTELSGKVPVSQLTANSKEFYFAYDETSEKYGYKAGATGEFHPFEEGGSGGIGWVTPPDLIQTGLTPTDNMTIISGGYKVVDNMCYIDLVYRKTSSSAGYITGFPVPGSQYAASVYAIAYSKNSSSSDIEEYIINATTIDYLGIDKSNGRLADGYSANYRRIIAMYHITT